MSDAAKCELCGEPMPPGEAMFNYHGYSGPCPKPPLPKPKTTSWRVRGEGDTLCVVDADSAYIVQSFTLPSTRSEKEKLAHAHLMSAAPDMLTMCEQLLVVLQSMGKPQLGGWNWPHLIERTTAVIAKATCCP